jgi:hypothetical protein
VIDDQNYFDQVMVYIHLNPVRSGLVDDPMKHLFSGHRELMGKTRKPLVNVDHALIGFGDTLKKARRHYSARVRAGLEGEASGELLGEWRRPTPPDRDLVALEPIHVDELGRSTGLERPDLDAQRYLLAACSILDIEFERLASRRRDSETAALRKLVAAVGIERWGQRAGRLAGLLEKHTVAVSRWVGEAARQRQADPEFGEKMKRLDEKLSKWALDARARGALEPRNPNN